MTRSPPAHGGGRGRLRPALLALLAVLALAVGSGEPPAAAEATAAAAASAVAVAGSADGGLPSEDTPSWRADDECHVEVSGEAQCMLSAAQLRAKKLTADIEELRGGTDSQAGASEQALAPGPGSNLCIDGHLAPAFYLVGVQNAATTSFMAELGRSPGIVKPARLEGEPWNTFKEPHIFGEISSFSKGKQYWLNHYPSCPSGKEQRRLVAWDCTPNYLVSPSAPLQMADWYGPKKKELIFMIMLREPAARMQSAFYHFFKNKSNLSFPGYVDMFLSDTANEYGGCSAFKSEPVCERGGCSWRITECQDAVFTESLYAPHIQAYFDTFDSAQFLVVPWHYYTRGVAPGSASVVDHVLARLGIPAGPKPKGKVIPQNVFPHKKLEQDIDSSALARLRALLDARGASAGAVAAVLSSSRAELFGFPEGRVRSEAAVAEWLASMW